MCNIVFSHANKWISHAVCMQITCKNLGISHVMYDFFRMRNIVFCVQFAYKIYKFRMWHESFCHMYFACDSHARHMQILCFSHAKNPSFGARLWCIYCCSHVYCIEIACKSHVKININSHAEKGLSHVMVHISHENHVISHARRTASHAKKGPSHVTRARVNRMRKCPPYWWHTISHMIYN